MFRDNLSDMLAENLEPLGLNFDHEADVEVFYNFAVTPWFRVTADAQFIRSLDNDTDDAVFLALRAQTKF